MDWALTRQLDELGSDRKLREVNLLNLVLSLHRQEIRDLKTRLSLVDFRTDIFSRLPTDLQLIVLDELDVVDLWPCFNVSTTWRSVITQVAAAKLLARRWFPGLVEQFLLRWKLPGDSDKLAQLLIDTVRKHYLRRTGRFRSALYRDFLLHQEIYFRLDPEFHPDAGRDSQHPYSAICGITNPLSVEPQTMVARMHYASGRLAWLNEHAYPPANFLVVVDDLKTGLRKVFNHSETMLKTSSIKIQGLGDKLLVVSSYRHM